MKRIYLFSAILGFIVPYYFLVSFLFDYGFNLPFMLESLFANDVSTFFAVDLIITAIVFLMFSYVESTRMGLGQWWPYLLATLLVGPSFSLPLFLYRREGAMHDPY